MGVAHILLPTMRNFLGIGDSADDKEIENDDNV